MTSEVVDRDRLLASASSLRSRRPRTVPTSGTTLRRAMAFGRHLGMHHLVRKHGSRGSKSRQTRRWQAPEHRVPKSSLRIRLLAEVDSVLDHGFVKSTRRTLPSSMIVGSGLPCPLQFFIRPMVSIRYGSSRARVPRPDPCRPGPTGSRPRHDPSAAIPRPPAAGPAHGPPPALE